MISEKQNLQSQFVTYLSVDCKSKINQELIEPKVKKFFDAKNISGQKPIDADKAISDLDFKTVDFSYFYDVIFYDIAKNKDGKIEIPVKYCITLDQTNCEKSFCLKHKAECKQTEENNKPGWYVCEANTIWYDEIILYNQSVFYFIYFDIEEIFEFLREN